MRGPLGHVSIAFFLRSSVSSAAQSIGNVHKRDHGRDCLLLRSLVLQESAVIMLLATITARFLFVLLVDACVDLASVRQFGIPSHR